MVLVLRWQCGDHGVVLAGVAHLGGTARRAEVVEELHVGLVVVRPFVRGVVLVVDRLDRADRFAGSAVDAFVRMDVQRTLTLIDAVDRALFNTCLVLDIYTRLRDYVRHVPGLSTLGPASRRFSRPATWAGLLTSQPIISQALTANLAGHLV
ncbi:hypothetical protein ARTHRO9AX_180479 [Arthrobacter sp. 9AX]|nr:hypothetical protein ARTHRO9AX_180479 [Arthrobacter sp. 9AX]